MCGINGFSFADKPAVARMNGILCHRGPDDNGTYSDNLVSIGQVRLSIIDLSPAGHQPMFYTRKGRTVGIVFNGEIYNYQEVREELKTKGYAFKSESDTEVILASYLEYGTDCVKKFNGMWSFCLYDKDNKLLFCSRDRAGKKPFYYYNENGKFIFSSELKGIVAHKDLQINTKENIDHEALLLYFSLGFIPAPKTIYKNVRKLEARQNLIFDLRAKKVTRTWTYYELPPYTPVYDKAKLIEEGRALLKDAVRLRMIADVPVGAFLSGGLDSSTVVAEMANFTKLQNLHTFSIGFEGKYDETPYIDIVKNHLGTQHHHKYFTQEDFDALLPKFAQMYDEPFGDYSGFPTYKVSELAREHVTVALSGDGGDEIFGGYMSHVTGYRMDLLRKIPKPLRKLGSKLPARKNLNGFTSFYLLREGLKVSLQEPHEFYASALDTVGIKTDPYKQWTREKLAKCLLKSGGNMGEAMRLYDLLYHTIPDLFLVKVDRASMQHALEVRAPLLDYRLMEFAQKIPAEWKYDAFKTKKLMREIIKDILPEAIVKRGKQGFTPPLEQWILTPKYSSLLESALPILKQFDMDLYNYYANTVFKENNQLYTNYKIRLVLFNLWYQRWIAQNRA